MRLENRGKYNGKGKDTKEEQKGQDENMSMLSLAVGIGQITGKR